MEAFTADCRVQAMRDGNVYITERPRRVKGTPLFREDNSTLTLGRDNRYYFVFTLPKAQLDLLSDRLVHQALAIAQKVDKMSAGRIGKKARKSNQQTQCVPVPVVPIKKKDTSYPFLYYITN